MVLELRRKHEAKILPFKNKDMAMAINFIKKIV